MRYLLVIFIVLSISVSGSANELVFKTALDGKVSILAPKSFKSMEEELLKIKYPSSRRPREVLSDATGDVTLTFDHTQNSMTQSQVIKEHQVISKAFHKSYPTAKWIRDEVVVKDGMNVMVLELIIPAVDTKIHNIIYGTSVEGRFLLVAFNTTVEQSEKWLPIGKKIMSSLKIAK